MWLDPHQGEWMWRLESKSTRLEITREGLLWLNNHQWRTLLDNLTGHNGHHSSPPGAQLGWTSTLCNGSTMWGIIAVSTLHLWDHGNPGILLKNSIQEGTMSPNNYQHRLCHQPGNGNLEPDSICHKTKKPCFVHLNTMKQIPSTATLCFHIAVILQTSYLASSFIEDSMIWLSLPFCF